jgi:membrane protease YdiL (CAAX protease family)
VVVKGYLRALLIAMAVPLLNYLFFGLAGFLQLRSLSPDLGRAVGAAAKAPLNIALVQAASVGLIFIVAFPHKRQTQGFLESVHVRPLVGGLAAMCFVGGAFLQLPLAEIGNLAQEVWPVSFDTVAYRHRLLNPTTWWGGVTALLAFVLVAPVTEELLFRGWLMQDLRRRYGTTPALIWSSVVFGLAHIGLPSAVPYAIAGGLVLGAVALRTRSTLASIAMHAGVNALPLLLPTALVRIDGFNTLDSEVVHISPWLLVVSLAGAGLALAIIWRSTEGQEGEEGEDREV